MSTISLDAVQSAPQLEELLRTATPHPASDSRPPEHDRFENHLKPERSEATPVARDESSQENDNHELRSPETTQDKRSQETEDEARHENEKVTTSDAQSDESHDEQAPAPTIAVEVKTAVSEESDVLNEVSDVPPESAAQLEELSASPLTPTTGAPVLVEPGIEQLPSQAGIGDEVPQPLTDSDRIVSGNEPLETAIQVGTENAEIVAANEALSELDKKVVLPTDDVDGRPKSKAVAAPFAQQTTAAASTEQSPEATPSQTDNHEARPEPSQGVARRIENTPLTPQPVESEDDRTTKNEFNFDLRPETGTSPTSTTPSGTRPLEHLLAAKNATTPQQELRAPQQARFVNRVARAFEAIGNRGGELRLRLSPPELGAMKIALRVEGGTLTAHVETDTAMARNALMDNLPVLRERLAEQGIKVEQFQVDVSDQQNGQDVEDRERRPRNSSTQGDDAEQPETADHISTELRNDNENDNLDLIA